jgi:hypothetical protein
VTEGQQAYVNVHFNAGEVQDPIGAGQPSPFADVVVTRQVIDTETGDVLSWAQGAAFGLPPTIVELEEATIVNIVVVLYDADGNPVDTAEIDLTWHGNDDATTRIDHQRLAGYFRQERFETATLAGRVVLDSGIHLAPSDAFSAVIGTANQISLP